MVESDLNTPEARIAQSMKIHELFKAIPTDIVSPFVHKPLQPKESTWYIVANEWFEKWRAYVNFDLQPDAEEVDWSSSHPGKLDNSAIILDTQNSDYIMDPKPILSYENTLLRKDLKEQSDYHVLSCDIWNFFKDFYGLNTNAPSGGVMNHEIERKAMVLNDESNECIVEVNLRPVMIFPMPNYELLRLQKPIFV